MLKSISPEEISVKPMADALPLVMPTVIGGYGNSAVAFTEQDVKEYYVIPKFKHKRVDFMIEVEGSSMYPKYNSGDVVALSSEIVISYNGIKPTLLRLVSKALSSKESSPAIIKILY